MTTSPAGDLWRYRCTVDRVVDGDTVDLDVDLGFGLTARIRVRLLGYDAAEIRGPERPEGLVVQAAVAAWVGEALLDQRQTYVRTEKTGKYGRWLADLWREGDDESLVEMLRRRFPR